MRRSWTRRFRRCKRVPAKPRKKQAPPGNIYTVTNQEQMPVVLRPRDLDEVLADFDARGVGVSERLTRDELYAEVIDRTNATH